MCIFLGMNTTTNETKNTAKKLTLKNIIFISLTTSFIAAGIVFTFLNQGKLKNKSVEHVLGSKNIYGFNIERTAKDSDYLIINFWASWCPPCIKEIPSLIQFVQNNPKYVVIAVSQDDGLPDIKNILKTFPDLKSTRFEIVYDETKSLSREFKVEKLPETFIYQFKTQKMMQISGSIDWTDPAAKKQFDQFFN